MNRELQMTISAKKLMMKIVLLYLWKIHRLANREVEEHKIQEKKKMRGNIVLL